LEHPTVSDFPIGVFDSGVGGLSIFNHIRAQFPEENIIYLADQAHVPYGSRTLEEIRAFSFSITDFLLARESKIVVVACNTASAAALHDLRDAFPEIPFVGMEPAVKPAAGTTHSGVVGVLATPTTFQGKLFASVVERFTDGVTILEQTLPGLVPLIESGQFSGPQVEDILSSAVEPLLDEGVDTFVLACTHYAFIIPTLEKIVGSDVEIIDPSPAIARQTGRLLTEHEIGNNTGTRGDLHFYTSGSADEFSNLVRVLTNEGGPTDQLTWSGEALI
jgi:glutamate racemase